MNTECLTVAHASMGWIIVIQVCYILLPLRMLYYTRWGLLDHHKALAIYSIMAVFVFCGLSGYTTSLLPQSYWHIREYMHIVLAVFSIMLHILGAPKILARTIER